MSKAQVFRRLVQSAAKPNEAGGARHPGPMLGFAQLSPTYAHAPATTESNR
jgi:hypothetical protein